MSIKRCGCMGLTSKFGKRYHLRAVVGSSPTTAIAGGLGLEQEAEEVVMESTAILDQCGSAGKVLEALREKREGQGGGRNVACGSSAIGRRTRGSKKDFLMRNVAKRLVPE